MRYVNLQSLLLILCLFLGLSEALAQARDTSQSGVIRVRKTRPSDSADLIQDAEARELMHRGDDALLRERRRGGVYRHGPVLGFDVMKDWGYRAGFQYTTAWLSTSMCFRHFPATKLAGISASFDFPLTTQRFRLGTEWTSMGQLNAWYHGLSIHAATLFPVHRKIWPNTVLKVGYSFRLNQDEDGVPLNSGFLFSLHLHF